MVTVGWVAGFSLSDVIVNNVRRHKPNPIWMLIKSIYIFGGSYLQQLENYVKI